MSNSTQSAGEEKRTFVLTVSREEIDGALARALCDLATCEAGLVTVYDVLDYSARENNREYSHVLSGFSWPALDAARKTLEGLRKQIRAPKGGGR